MNCIHQARALLDSYRPQEAVGVLQAAGARGDASALVELALWRLQGVAGDRDLRESRALFARAGRLGDLEARMVHAAFLAQGLGGPREWAASLETLAAVARERPDMALQYDLIKNMDVDADGGPRVLPARKILSRTPDAQLFPGLLSERECEALISAALPLLTASVVVHPQTGIAMPHPVRTSDNAFFPYVSETPFIHALNRRLAAASGTDVTCGEPLQVLRYRPGQQYRPHHDALPATDNQRVVTMISYLNNAYSGGETQFIHTALLVKGDVGDVLLFRNVDEAGLPDKSAQHAGLPVSSGEKFIATRWIRETPFGPR